LEYSQQKLPIRMNLGDPTLARNLGPHDAMLKAVGKVLSGQNFNGYLHATGTFSLNLTKRQKFRRKKCQTSNSQEIYPSKRAYK
jgi:hypothetical protein